eukprot:scaffold15741_cov168-Skeletonema_marinoi.AAC.7
MQLQDGTSQDECVGWSCRKVLGDTGPDVRVPHRKDERKVEREERAFLKLKKVLEQEVWGKFTGEICINCTAPAETDVESSRLLTTQQPNETTTTTESTAPKQSLLRSFFCMCIYS